MSGQFHCSFVELAGRAPAFLYEPDQLGRKSRIGLVLMHSDDSYLGFWPAPELAKRGYRVLAGNVENRTASLDEKMMDVRDCVEFLRNYPGIEKILLIGHSGGATLMSAYQRAAENGYDSLRVEGLIAKSHLQGKLTPADGMLFLDSNFGNGAMTLMSLDPAIESEEHPQGRIPELDLFDPANGYSISGTHYSEEFKARFFRAQGARGNALIDKALSIAEEVAAGKGRYSDDAPFDVPGANQIAPNNKLFPQDTNLLAHTKGEWPLLHGDGTVSLEVVKCLRIPRAGMQSSASLRQGAIQTTVHTFLRSQAVRTTEDYHVGEDGVYGIDWESTYCCTPSNVSWIHVPTLMMGMTGSYEYLASELLYERSAACDKTRAFVAGAGHNFAPAYEAEQYTGEFGDTVTALFNYVDAWIDARDFNG